jgi:hypothetical protein
MTFPKAPVSRVEEWVGVASNGLCDDAVQRIRAEITDHYFAATDAGQSPEAALQALGDPQKASRNYRKVYATTNDLLAVGNPAFVWLEWIASVIFVILPMQAAMWDAPFFSVNRWIVFVLSSIHLVFHCFFRPSSVKRARYYWWGSIAQVIAIGFLIGPRVFLAGIFFLGYAHIRWVCLQFHRRLSNTPRPQPDQWLSTATRGLCAEAAAQVRTEITERYESALAAGASPGEAVALLGDPNHAKREYRRVLLTEFEVDMAQDPQPEATLRLVLRNVAISAAAILGNYVWGIPNVSTVAFIVFMSAHGLAVHFCPATTTRRSTWYMIADALCTVSVGLLLWGWSIFWIVALVIVHSDYKRWIALRKLGGKPAPVRVREDAAPGSPLTPYETQWLFDLQHKRPQAVGSSLWFVMLVFLTIVLAAGAGNDVVKRSMAIDLAAFSAAILAWRLPILVSFQTPETGRRYRHFKWAVMAITALVPPVSVLILGHGFGEHRFAGLVGLILTVSYFVLLFAAVHERTAIKLRRKLPLSEWPKELYS